MELGENRLANPLLILIIIGVALYLIFKSDDDTKKRRKRRRNESTIDPYAVRQTGRNVVRKVGTSSPRQTRSNSNRTNSSYIRSAKQEESRKNYDEASELYLKGDQVYSSAKMKALKGPIGAPEALSLIETYAPDQVEMITRNLVNEFYYRLNQPATAAAILRAWGHDEEAGAVEVAAGIPTQTVSFEAPTRTVISSDIETPSFDPEITNEEYQESHSQVYDSTTTTGNGDSVDETINEPPKMDNISNVLMMASVTLTDSCSVCKKSINTGDSFLQCLSCGKPGHYKHLAEMVKVTGKCPICRQRLVTSMFDL